MASKLIVLAESLKKSYGNKTVLREATLSLEAGSALCLFGPNGSGKSTLLDILALAARPDGGLLSVNGVDAMADPRAARARIGYVPQDIALFGELTVQENLLCWSKGSRKSAKADAERVMEELILTSIRRRRVGELSGGMKRRVNMAVALLGDPELLVLDEPFAGVDFENTDNMLLLLSRLKKRGAAIVISDHSAHRLLPIMDSAMVLKDGETLFYGTREELLMRGDGADGALRNILAGGTS